MSEKTADYVREVVSKAPPLTESQVLTLQRLFTSVDRPPVPTEPEPPRPPKSNEAKRLREIHTEGNDT